ncbi:MAG: DinB family protein [Ginsengibacter sp.]
MSIETKDKTGLLDQIDEVVSQLIELMFLVDENDVNTIPYQDGWTAGQLFEHVTKSTGSLAKAMKQEGAQADRDPGEHIENLKKIFLDFSSKMKAPEFIVPLQGWYEKSSSIQKLGGSFQQLRENAKNTDLTVIIKGTPLGDATKWEMLHFILYHTQRHLHQMKKIYEALKNRL